MHYANGRAAKIGDMVRGKGYNIKREITGRLVAAQPDSSSCNCQVAHVDTSSQLMLVGYPDGATPGAWKLGGNTPQVMASIEYGQLDAFNAIDPATGEILPAEDTAVTA